MSRSQVTESGQKPLIQENSVSTKESKNDSKPSVSSSIRSWSKRNIIGEADGLREWCCERGLLYVVISNFLRGVGQVCFMDNPWSGLIIFAELLYFNYYYAILGLIGGFTNFATAVALLGTDLLHLPTSNCLNNGLFVYNGLLVGLMTGTFVEGLDTSFESNNGYLVFLKLIPCVVLFAYISTSIQIGMTNLYPTFPVYTFPFNLAAFLWLPAAEQISWIDSNLHPHLVDNDAMTDSVYAEGANIHWSSLLFNGIFKGPDQIYLCGDQYIGIVFIFAMSICNWKAAILSLWGSVIGTLFAILVGVDVDRITFGLHSYNTALTMVACSCIFADFNLKNLLMAHFHCFLAVALELSMITVMAPLGLPYCTMPFCLSTMLFAVFAYRKQKEVSKSKRKDEAVEKALKPEEHQMQGDGHSMSLENYKLLQVELLECITWSVTGVTVSFSNCPLNAIQSTFGLSILQYLANFPTDFDCCGYHASIPALGSNGGG